MRVGNETDAYYFVFDILTYLLDLVMPELLSYVLYLKNYANKLFKKHLTTPAEHKHTEWA